MYKDAAVDALALMGDVMGHDVGAEAVAVIEHATIGREPDAVGESDIAIKSRRPTFRVYAIKGSGRRLGLVSEGVEAEASGVDAAEGVGEDIIEERCVGVAKDRARLPQVYVTEVPARYDDAPVAMEQDPADAFATWHDCFHLTTRASTIDAPELGIAEVECAVVVHARSLDQAVAR